MPYGRYGRRTRMVAIKGKTTPRKYKSNRKKYSKAPKTTFTQKVQKIIASNVENKYTASVDYVADIGKLNYSVQQYSPLTTSLQALWFVWAPGNGVNGMFNISQGTSVQQRIGNKIKLKRWVIKGMVQPNPTYDDVPAASTPALGQPYVGISPNSLCGFVDIYFGRRQDNTQPVGNDLNKFYQNGATDITPLGKLQETLYPINKDLYKVYYHKRFKVGVGNGFSGTGPSLNYDAQPLVPGANGFGLTKSFGFDVCKYIAKNKVICFDESDTSPQYDNIENLCLWATFHPASGDLRAVEYTGPTSPTPPAYYQSQNKTFYQLNVMSYAEYEDA